MLFHFGAGYVVNDFGDTAPITNFDMVKTLGIAGGTLGPTTGARVPVFGQGATPQTGTLMGPLSFGGVQSLGPYTGQVRAFLQRPTGNTSLSWVKGNHSYKFGGEVRFDGYPTVTNTNTSGNFAFSTNQTDNSFFAQGQAKGGSFTGFPYASLLLGAVNSVTIAQPADTRGGRGFYAWFAQDTWKITRKLTLDYGLRWDLMTYPREQYGRSPDFSPTLANSTAGGHPGATIYEATCNCRFANNYPWAYAPRLGGCLSVQFQDGVARGHRSQLLDVAGRRAGLRGRKPDGDESEVRRPGHDSEPGHSPFAGLARPAGEFVPVHPVPSAAAASAGSRSELRTSRTHAAI